MPVFAAEISKKRLILGLVLVLIGQSFPLWIPVISSSGLSDAWKQALTGIFAFGFPNLFMVTTVMILGNSGFEYLKKKIFGWFKKQFAPKDFVGRFRYLIGLILFFTPVLFAWASPYLIYVIPDIGIHHVAYGIAGDAMLILGLFVLGGNFWDKLRALFLRKAKVTF